MNKFTVRIDRNSIQANPDYGSIGIQTETGMPQIHLTIRDLDRVQCHLIEQQTKLRCISWDETINAPFRDTQAEFTGLVTPNVEIFLKMTALHYSYKIQRDCLNIRSMRPASRFVFKFHDTDVSCRHCGCFYDYKTIISGDEYDYCPKCGVEDPCLIEFEQITKIDGGAYA